MSWILAAIVIVAILMVALDRRSQKSEPARTALPYQRTKALFSPAERSFLGVLHQAVGGNATVLGKVRVADVAEPTAGLNGSERQRAFNRISGKHFDFLLCDSKNLSILCAIELDDRSHQTKSRDQRDEFLKGVCEAAGVPLVQVPAKSGYVIDDVKRMLAPHLTTKGNPIQKPSPPRKASKYNGKVCPNCSATMVKRVTQKGSHAGMEFWACSKFPECKTVEAITN
jgi:hypothetical protein